MKSEDAVNPTHYRGGEGVQLIEIIRGLPFSLGNAVKYVYRAEHKHETPVEDLQKALWYLDDYTEHPSCLLNRLSYERKVMDEVLLTSTPWEKVAVKLLLRLDDVVADGGDSELFYSAAIDARQHILRRIAEVK